MTGDAFDIDVFPVGCILTDANGVVLQANQYLHDDLGFDIKALQGKLIDALFTNASMLLLESFVHPAIQRDGRTDEQCGKHNTYRVVYLHVGNGMCIAPSPEIIARNEVSPCRGDARQETDQHHIDDA